MIHVSKIHCSRHLPKITHTEPYMKLMGCGNPRCFVVSPGKLAKNCWLFHVHILEGNVQYSRILSPVKFLGKL